MEWRGRDVLNAQPTSIISKSSLLTPHSGQTKSSGTFSQRVPGGDAFILIPFGFVIDPAANDTLPFPHLRALTPVPFQGAVRYLRPRKSQINLPRRAAASGTWQRARRCARPSRNRYTSLRSTRMTCVTILTQRLPLYMRLMRLDRPVGTLLLLWPTLAALWIAADGRPPVAWLLIFALGTVLMRAAGCVINDYADRDSTATSHGRAIGPDGARSVRRAAALTLVRGLVAIALVLLVFLNPTRPSGSLSAAPASRRCTRS